MENFMQPNAQLEVARTTLSVIIPSHNPETLFFIEIGKLVAEHPDWQVVVIDDASDHDLRDFLPKAANLTVFRNMTAQGAGTSRNVGLKVACGDYTVFLDDDDFMDWRVIEALIQKMDEAPAVDMAVSSYQFLRDGKLAPAHQKDTKILLQTLRGQSSRVVILEDHEALLRLTNYPWNKLYRTDFIRRINLRFSDTMVQNDVYAHWQSFLTASRILVSNLVQCTQTVSTAGSRISNTWDGRRLQAFTALRETYALVQYSALPRVEAAFWAFYYDLVHWMIRSAPPEIRIKLMQEHVRFAGIALQNTTTLEADTGIKPWSLWDMGNTDDMIASAPTVTEKSIDTVYLEIWLSEISRLKRLSVELRGDNDRLRGEIDRLRGENDRLRQDSKERGQRVDVLSRELTEVRSHLEKVRQDSMALEEVRQENFEIQRQLNSKAARWAFALRGIFRYFFPVRELKQK